MRVEEVHFNHDNNSATSDALNIRKNAKGDSIEAPEWKRGLPAQPAAYAAAALGAQVTIKARFSSGPANEARKIRAVDAWAPANPRGCLGWIISLIALLIRSLFGNVLGDTDEQTVAFDRIGNSGLVTFDLVNHKLKTSGVGIRTTEWKWQAFENGSWQNFDTTQHKVYLVLDVPSGPWEQDPTGNNTQLPWTDALDKACVWALGATTLDEAAERITIAVNTQPNQTYTGSTSFGTFSTYHLTSYLNQLDTGSPFNLNCTDCADAVTTLSNLLGCDLFEGRFTNLTTRKFLQLGGNPAVEADWVSMGWSYHEICWLHEMGQNELIYDACVQVDMDDTYADPVHVAKHPVKMRFGMNEPDDYRHRLVATGKATVQNHPIRRSVD
ncbi:MAG: hypothetical protein AABO41_23125 [Acidobacteriota bacterium]